MPGDEISLKLLYWDGKAATGARRDIEICFSTCFNPLGDLYYNCYTQLPSSPRCVVAGAAADASASAPFLDASSGGDAGVSPGETDHVASYSLKIRDDIVSSRPPPANGAPYGLAYVLFTVCAGRVGPRTPANPNDLPLGCFDELGNALGADDFVPGFSSVYVYGDRRNLNPVINDLSLFANCSGSDCSLKGSAEPNAMNVREVPSCPSGDCTIDLKVDVDRNSAEVDIGSFGLHGEQLQEQLWVAFYATRGDFTKPLRLVNDASSGWNDDNATGFKVPAEVGPVRLWAIVHDNRGGVAWMEAKILVTDGRD
jgi:hypothetical protein